MACFSDTFISSQSRLLTTDEPVFSHGLNILSMAPEAILFSDDNPSCTKNGYELRMHQNAGRRDQSAKCTGCNPLIRLTFVVAF